MVVYFVMLPLFKSHYSIGKSILTLDSSSNKSSRGSDSIFDIAEEYNLSKVILVEDSLTGFMEAVKSCQSTNKDLVFGLRLSCFNKDLAGEDFNTEHKVIVFAKNSEGCALLNKIYTYAFCETKGSIGEKDLIEMWDAKNLKLAVPFYDSFIFNNLTMLGSACSFPFLDLDPTFFIESNYLPFDNMVKQAVLSYCKSNNKNTEITKSIYYKHRSDFEAFQTYKCICGRSFSSSRTLSTPKQDHLASSDFSFESYLEHEQSASN
tara:strand:+ start:10224 stop:11012 length:789 start_codon:yes stop_codon:yes gene_type:complete